jgi:HK97 family phage major capsid protein
MTKEEIKSAMQEANAPILAKLEEADARLKALETPKATNHATGIVEAGAGRITDVKAASEGKGIDLARYVKVLYAGKTMPGASPFQIAKSRGYDRVAAAFAAREKALVQGNVADGGALVPDEFMAELIPLLRNATVVRKAGARAIDMGASLTIPRQTGAGTAYWGNEGTAITSSQQALGSLQLQEKKLTALTAVSNDLMRNASVSADEFVRDDLVQVIAIAEDLAFLRGAGSAGAPRGIKNWLASGNVFTETITTPGSPTLAEVRKELAKLKKKVLASNKPLVKPVWFMSAQIFAALEGISDGNGNAVYSAGLNMPSPVLLGFPVYVTEQIPSTINSGGTADTGGSASELHFIDMDGVVIGDSMQLEVEVFPNGTYVASGAARSGISYDETVIRGIKKADLIARYDTTGAVVKNCSWA